jgi:negative regulator of flagellin synthesis FlgM
MTDAINPFSRQAPSNIAARKLQDKASAPEAMANAAASVAPGPLSDVVSGKPSSALTKSAGTGSFSAISARLSQEPDFDRAKVDSIKRAIEDGQYPLNPRRIAESFVALEQLIGD